MKKNVFHLLLTGAFATIVFVACNSEGTKEGEQTTTTTTEAPAIVGQSGVVDDQSQKNVVGVAVGSPDHTTLVTAVKAAELVDALSNAGPFTVFAPTNAAFEKLPAGTVEGLLVPEKKEALQEILQYHVSVGVYKLENLKDGQQIDEVFGGKVTIGVKDGKYTVNGANIIATVPASNGIVYVIDQVIFAPAKK